MSGLGLCRSRVIVASISACFPFKAATCVSRLIDHTPSVRVTFKVHHSLICLSRTSVALVFLERLYMVTACNINSYTDVNSIYKRLGIIL